MKFEEFWKNNRDRYEKLAETNVMLAINTAAEEAWELSQSNTVACVNRGVKIMASELRRFSQ